MAQVMGYEQIELDVFDDNIKAQKLYGKIKNLFINEN